MSANASNASGSEASKWINRQTKATILIWNWLEKSCSGFMLTTKFTSSAPVTSKRNRSIFCGTSTGRHTCCFGMTNKPTELWWFSVVKKNMESLCVELKTGSRDHILDSLQTESAFGLQSVKDSFCNWSENVQSKRRTLCFRVRYQQHQTWFWNTDKKVIVNKIFAKKLLLVVSELTGEYMVSWFDLAHRSIVISNPESVKKIYNLPNCLTIMNYLEKSL